MKLNNLIHNNIILMLDLFLMFNHLNNNHLVHQVFNQLKCSNIWINTITCHLNRYSNKYPTLTPYFNLSQIFPFVHQYLCHFLIIWPQSNVIHTLLSGHNTFIGFEYPSEYNEVEDNDDNSSHAWPPVPTRSSGVMTCLARDQVGHAQRNTWARKRGRVQRWA